MRGRVPWGVLALLFLIVPLLEIYLVILAGRTLGIGWTVLILAVDSLLGAALLKREGSAAWTALQQALAAYRMPAREIADGVLILVGGTMLLLPGFVTDVVGFLFILPVSRPLARRALTTFVARRLLGPVGPSEAASRERRRGSRGPQSEGPGTRQSPGPETVRGEVVD